MSLELDAEPTVATRLVKHLRRNAQGAKRQARAGRVQAKLARIALDNPLRELVYGLGALVAGTGVALHRGKLLQTLAEFLDLPGSARKEIDKAVVEASATKGGLAALFAAYQDATRETAKQERVPQLATPTERSLRDSAQKRLLGLAMLDSSEVSKFLGSRSKNQRQYAATLRRRGALLGLPHSNRYVYPKFQFDLTRQQVRPVVAEVGRILGAGKDPWAAVSWWTSPNPRLSGRRAPVDLLDSPQADALPDLARALVENVG